MCLCVLEALQAVCQEERNGPGKVMRGDVVLIQGHDNSDFYNLLFPKNITVVENKKQVNEAVSIQVLKYFIKMLYIF